MRVDRFVMGLVAFSLVACARQPRLTAPRPVSAATVYGDDRLVQVSAVPRPREWFDDVQVQSPPGAHVAVFEYTKRGKPQLRVLPGGRASAVSSIHWRTRGYASRGSAPGFSGATPGQTVCQSGGWVQTGAGGQGYAVPMSCTDHAARPGYAPSYTSSQHPDYRAVLVIVSDSALRETDRERLLRYFTEARGVPHALSMLANQVAPTGRWAAVVHTPSAGQ